MRKNSTINVRVQPPEDQIDFRCSDTFRDHYAAQGLTYPSGRFPRNLRDPHTPHIKFTEHTQELDAALQETQGWKSRAIYLETRCAKLEEELKRI